MDGWIEENRCSSSSGSNDRGVREDVLHQMDRLEIAQRRSADDDDQIGECRIPNGEVELIFSHSETGFGQVDVMLLLLLPLPLLMGLKNKHVIG